jgi:uncharacterized protein
MSAQRTLFIAGASTRAAAVSALRAGLRPCCADLFADADLQARCPVECVPADAYPHLLLPLLRAAEFAPWMYTGGLENFPELIDTMAGLCPLWGNDAAALRLCRSPLGVARLLAEHGVPRPAVRTLPPAPPGDGSWLIKPLAGAGGRGIRVWTGGPKAGRPRRTYFQEFVPGEPTAAVFLGDDGKARLLGVTRQLAGEPWLHARPFRYCGSIGPLSLTPPLRQALQRLGDVLAAGCGLRGLFGVDFILRGGVPWPVEINPRYTASVEVLEYAAGVPALALHRRAFDPAAPEPPALPADPFPFLGKAVLFARAPLTFPADGPWLEVLRSQPLHEPPAFADVPHPGERIAAGRPVLTFFARGDSLEGCRDALQKTARDLDRRLFGR